MFTVYKMVYLSPSKLVSDINCLKSGLVWISDTHCSFSLILHYLENAKTGGHSFKRFQNLSKGCFTQALLQIRIF